MIFIFQGTSEKNFFNKLLFNLTKNGKKNSILIIPNKYSFYTEKKICRFLNKTNKKINLKILTFNKFCFEIFKKYGFVAGDFATKFEKSLVLFITFLKLKNYTFEIQYMEKILNSIEKLKENNITTINFKEKIKLIKNNELEQKMKEFLKIFSLYENFLKKNYKDPTANLNVAYKISKKKPIFKNTNFYFMFFQEFNLSQLNLIKIILKQTDATFFMHYEKNKPLFLIQKNTINNLTDFAKKNKIKIKKQNVTTNYNTKQKDLNFLKEHIFKTSKNYKFNSEIKNIKIILAKNIQEEINDVIFKITTFKKNGFNWQDIAILTNDIEKYKFKLKVNLKNLNIPYYVQENLTANKILLIKIVEHILNLNTNFNVNSYLTILKTGLTKFKVLEVAYFENYIKIWQIKKQKEILKPFSNNPFGFSENFSSEKVKKILKINNKIRENLKEIVSIFNEKPQSSKAISLKLIKILEILGIKNNIEKNILNLVEEWEVLIKILETIFKLTNNFKLTLKEFKFLFCFSAKNLNINKTPKFLNSVYIGNFKKPTPMKPKITIILGVNEENFPFNHTQSNEIFTNEEIIELRKINLNFLKTLKEKNLTENFLINLAITSPTKKLLIYSSNISKKEILKNETIKKLTNFFGNKMVETLNVKNYTLKHITEEISSKNLIKKHNEKFLANAIFPENQISPSKIEQFFICPFLYFCNNILKIKPIEKAELNNKIIGKMIHYVLENIVALNCFLNMEKDAISEEIEIYLKLFINKNLSGKKNKTLEFLEKYYSFKKYLITLCCNIKDELKQINFKPIKFEYRISKNSKIKPLKIKVNENFNILVKGIIDRIDIKPTNNEKFIRIIDYKYKKQSLNFTEIIMGVNLQILIYLLILNENFKNVKNIKIFSALNMPTIGEFKKYNNLKPINNKECFEDVLKKALKPSGVIINDDENLQILNNFKNPAYEKFSPLKITKDENFNKKDITKIMFNKNELRDIFNFIEKKIKIMCNDVLKLNFKKSPIYFKNTNQLYCEFCNFKEICSNKKEITKPKKQKQLEREDFFEILNN